MNIGRVILATQAQRVALSALDPVEVLKLAKEWSMRREFRRRWLPDTPNDLNVDHLETIARCAGIGGDPGSALVAATNFVTPPWMSDSAVTNSWVADPRKVTFGTGNGVASLAAEKGSIALAQAGGASKEPQLATSGWGKSAAPCITFDGVAQHFTGDGLAASVTGNDVPFSMIISVDLHALSGGLDQVFWAFANTSDANSWHYLWQGQNAGIEVYRIRRASAAAFTIASSTFPFPRVDALNTAGFYRSVLTMLFTGTAVTLRVDGIVSSISAAGMDVASLTYSKFTVGAFRGATTSGYMNFKLRRMIFGASAFGSGTYTPAENYMRQENQMYPSPKKGVICNPFATYSFASDPDPSFGAQQNLNTSWFANYTPTPWGRTSSFTSPIGETLPPLTSAGPSLPAGKEFVPMLASLAVADDAQSRTWAKANGTYLLTFNEPDAAGTTNPCISVANALARWPTIRAMGMLTGAPAVTASADLNTGWLHDFMTDASAPQVDFIPVHSYINATNFGNPAAATTGILNYVNGVASLYSKPVWLHEFNAIDFSTNPWTAPTTQQMIDILQRLMPWLEANGNLARYSLYEIFCPLIGLGTFTSIGLTQQDGTMPSIGPTYADLGRI